MQYRTLGRTGVQVSTLALGAMNFGRAIEEIVAPGVDLAAGEKFDTPPSLLDATQRRR
jgi:aryl-alcohol dehydrogenase-like predicted oxidoreductase